MTGLSNQMIQEISQGWQEPWMIKHGQKGLKPWIPRLCSKQIWWRVLREYQASSASYSVIHNLHDLRKKLPGLPNCVSCYQNIAKLLTHFSIIQAHAYVYMQLTWVTPTLISLFTFPLPFIISPAAELFKKPSPPLKKPAARTLSTSTCLPLPER